MLTNLHFIQLLAELDSIPLTILILVRQISEIQLELLPLPVRLHLRLVQILDLIRQVHILRLQLLLLALVHLVQVLQFASRQTFRFLSQSASVRGATSRAEKSAVAIKCNSSLNTVPEELRESLISNGAHMPAQRQ